MNPRLILLSVALLFLSVAAAHDGDPARAWLEKSWLAAGGHAWDDVTTQRSKLDLQLPGLNGEGGTSTDIVAGRFVDKMTLGPVKFAEGYDGKTHWRRDTSGQVQVLQGEKEREALVNNRYQRMLAYWYPQRWPATLGDLGRTTDGERHLHKISITPEGGRRFELWIDEQSHLIDRIIENDGSRDSISFFSDYRSEQGRKIAHSIRVRSGEAKYDQHIRLRKVIFNQTFGANAFTQPPAPKADFVFAGGKAATTVPFRLLNNHTYVHVKINGQGPYDFILDTGGANVLDESTAKKLHLATQGKLEARGVGEQSQDLSLARVDRVQIGDVLVRDQTFFVIDFAQLSQAEGVHVAGLVGYEIFKRFSVRLDYASSRLTLNDPSAFQYRGNGVPVPFEFDGHTPVVKGSIDGLHGKLTLDTGSRNFVSLHAPFVTANGLLQKHPHAIQAITGWGVGGPTRGRVLRGTTLTIGDSLTIDRPVMTLSLQKSGAMTDQYLIANLGAGTLRHFNLLLDYAHKRVFFERHAGSDQVDNYDRAGVWLNDVGDVFEVMGVVKNGPADRAGLKVGDRISQVDGKVANKLFLPELRKRWSDGEIGKRITLSYQRGNASHQTSLVLADLIETSIAGQ